MKSTVIKLFTAATEPRWALLGLVAFLPGCAAGVPAQPEAPAIVAEACPVGFPTDSARAVWGERVEAARAITDREERRDSMLALVREALSGSDLEVRSAGSSSPGRLHPRDYEPAPVVNFDVDLGNKRSSDAAFFFVDGSTPYVIIGPGALDKKGPLFVREHTEHELFHSRYHVGDPRPLVDRELEVRTHIWVTMFHEKYPHKMRWSPLVSFYEEASPVEQELALDKLVEYYRNPPTPPIAPECVSTVRAEFLAWLDRRLEDSRTSSSKLITDLQAELRPGAAGRAEGAR